MQKIKNIIFDLGGVIFDVNYQLTIDAFKKLGASDFKKVYSKKEQNKLFDQFEEGKISPVKFRDGLRKKFRLSDNDATLDKAWNAMLQGWTKNKLDFIKDLNNNYRVFLLSNTNETHLKEVFKMLERQIGIQNVNNYFEQAYYSNIIGLRKPNAAVFKYVLTENSLKGKETLFIDDSPQHVEGAKQAGMKGYYLKKDQNIIDNWKEIINV